MTSTAVTSIARALGLVLLGTLVSAAQQPETKKPATREKVREQIVKSELAIDARFRDFGNPNRMGLVGVTRGGYIDGFGAVFNLQVALVPVPNIGPFRPRISDKEKQQLNMRKRQRLEDLEVRARTILLEEGDKLTVVPAGEKIALVVSLFHFAWEDLSGLPSQLVMQARKKTLADHRAGRLDLAGLKKQLEVNYF